MNLGLAGKYTFHKQKVAMKDGKPLLDENGNQILIGEREKIAEFENLITNNGLDLIGKRASCNHMILSSDNSAPLVTDSSVTVLGVSTTAATGDATRNKNVTTAPYWVSYQCVRRFEAGVATGNIAKVAISNNSQGTDLFSIALVKDGNGNPTTITKLADEILDVAYELKTYLNTSDTTSTIKISGKTHNITSRLWGFNLIGGAWVDKILYIYDVRISESTLTPITGTYSGISVGTTFSPYITSSYTLNVNIPTIPISMANYPAGISTVFLTDGGSYSYNSTSSYQFGISPPIMKTSIHTLQLPPITLSWGRYEGAL